MKKIILFFFLFAVRSEAGAVNYYVNAFSGNDANSGTHPQQAFRSTAALQQLTLVAGDSILFARGQSFSGGIRFSNIRGTLLQPVVLGSYTYGGDSTRPVLDAGDALHVIHLENVSFVDVIGLELTARKPYPTAVSGGSALVRCGILVEVTAEESFESVRLRSLYVHDIFLMEPGFKRSAAEVKTANGTQGYGWGIRFINSSKSGKLRKLEVLHSEIRRVSHTGLKFTSPREGITEVTVAYNRIEDCGGPGLQLSGASMVHVHHNQIQRSGSVADSRNWGRGSGMWTWSCRDVLIEYNRFESANGPGDSAGVHIDYNCSDVVVQYNVSRNNAGGFCEILGNNYNCAYRYNISIDDGHRVKGQRGAFQEGKIFWLSGYQGDKQKPKGPFNSYFYNNTVYVSDSIVPRIAVSPSAEGVLIANNIFYFAKPAMEVAGDQQRKEAIAGTAKNMVFTNNLFLDGRGWPVEGMVQQDGLTGDPLFIKAGGADIPDYSPREKKLISNRGKVVQALPGDSVGIRIGLLTEKDIMGRKVGKRPDLGALEVER